MRIKNKPLRQGIITLVILIPIYILDGFIESNISKNNIYSVHGCLSKAEITSDKSGINSVQIIADNSEDIGFATYDRNIIKKINSNPGCYQFYFYKHSFLLPNIGRKWLVKYQ